jgi:hypothetical protein
MSWFVSTARQSVKFDLSARGHCQASWFQTDVAYIPNVVNHAR